MAESVTRAEAGSSQRAKDSARGPGRCALGGLLLTRTIRTTLLSGIEDAVCVLGQIPRSHSSGFSSIQPPQPWCILYSSK